MPINQVRTFTPTCPLKGFGVPNFALSFSFCSEAGPAAAAAAWRA